MSNRRDLSSNSHTSFSFPLNEKKLAIAAGFGLPAAIMFDFAQSPLYQ